MNVADVEAGGGEVNSILKGNPLLSCFYYYHFLVLVIKLFMLSYYS